MSLAFSGKRYLPPPPLLTPDAKPHRTAIGFQNTCLELSQLECAGRKMLSKGGGGEINPPETNQTLMPPEDMEPSAPCALTGVFSKAKDFATSAFKVFGF
jgi:hypothetical protein